MRIECESTGDVAIGSNGVDLQVIRTYRYRGSVEAASLEEAADLFAYKAYGFRPEWIGGIPIRAYCLACRCPIPFGKEHAECRKMRCDGRYPPALRR